MKYFAIILLSFCLASTAFAAKEVPGTVPVVPPLQPPAAGVAPNMTGNVEHSEPGRQAQPAPDDSADGGSGQNSGALPQNANGQNTAGAQGGSQGVNPWPAIIILLVGGAGGLGYFVFGRKSKV